MSGRKHRHAETTAVEYASNIDLANRKWRVSGAAFSPKWGASSIRTLHADASAILSVTDGGYWLKNPTWFISRLSRVPFFGGSTRAPGSGRGGGGDQMGTYWIRRINWTTL